MPNIWRKRDGNSASPQRAALALECARSYHSNCWTLLRTTVQEHSRVKMTRLRPVLDAADMTDSQLHSAHGTF